ncbi:hypothetical protein BDZ94DRAFT_1180587, partial [Collybia nuda]
FKKPTFQHATESVALLAVNGQTKDVKSCQNKWMAVSLFFIVVVMAIQSISGWHWDDTTCASITANTASSWDDYVKKHPEAKPFRNHGWPHLNKFLDIMPSTPAGANVYHPSTSQPLPSTLISQPPSTPTDLHSSSSPEPDSPSDDENPQVNCLCN